MRSKRLGNFTLSKEIIEEKPWLATRIMSQCIVIKAEFMYMNDTIRYTAISRLFEETALGTIPPDYQWMEGEDGTLIALKSSALQWK